MNAGDDPADRPGGEAGAGVLGALVAELIRLVLQHLTLARAEMADSGAALGVAALLTAAALVTGFTALILLLVGIALVLAIWIPIWAAFFLVGGVALLGAAGLFMLAKAHGRRCTLVPRRALASLHRQFVEIGGKAP